MHLARRVCFRSSSLLCIIIRASSKPGTTFSPTDLSFIKINRNNFRSLIWEAWQSNSTSMNVSFWMVKCFCILIRHSNGVWEECDIVQSIVQKILWENDIFFSLIWEKLHKKMFCLDCSTTSLCKVLHRKVALILYDLCLHTCWNKLDFF